MVRVDRDEVATYKLLVFGRVALVCLSILLGQLPSDELELAFRAFEAQLIGQDAHVQRGAGGGGTVRARR